MQVNISGEPGRLAATQAANSLRQLLANRESARILVATGNSQLRFLELLTQEPEMDWGRVELFHLDEYIGIGTDHPASFARYIQEKVIAPTGITRHHLLSGLADYAGLIERVGSELAAKPVDLAFAGIGENGHLAFNDPPADFETESPYLLVDLDEVCRHQQVSEGWFKTLADVPRQAISISIHQLMKAREIICVVPDLRKARAVAACLDGEVSPEVPASILRLHPNAWLYLDADSASLLQSSLPLH
jgi:glucosamine-6-phosphate deaminase